MNVKISSGNSKMGSIRSVSLPAGVTCRNDCECKTKCYAKKLERIRKNVREAYKSNYQLLKCAPDVYWREVEAAVMVSRFFRFHVSGDIVDADYFRRMVFIAGRNRHCHILCFTKKYDIVNQYIESHKYLPDNLHVIMSAWKGLKMENPFELPEAHVRYRNGETTAAPNAKECGGNCSECAITEGGCWSLGIGDQVVFNEH